MKHIIFFDDQCPLCWRSVNRVRSWDKKKIFRYVPLREAEGYIGSRSPKNTLILLEKPSGRIWTKGRAVMRILWLIGGPKKLIGWLCFVPLIDPIYSFIAKRRHRF